MTPADRREQLLAHGVRLLGSHSLDELTTDLMAREAGISRGLLYHYFDNLDGFRRDVVRAAIDDLVAITAPDDGDDPVAVLAASLEAYVDYVIANLSGYQSMVRAAQGGNEEMRTFYEQARASLTGRMFDRAGADGTSLLGYDDTPTTRLLVHGWSALAESVVLTWAEDDHQMSKQQLIAALAASLFGVLDASR